ncbi:hypothetical protein [Planococcus salinarum]|uniref:hypothetical protein n=1 Tax=Planococcus salinarum TaxID=622695 RepID=UPI000E3E1F79|nr:hypothetical protein [Planococcus salinarum]TAA72567.1 hypothetical protein D2909_05195 [Planococcus salinarum]
MKTKRNFRTYFIPEPDDAGRNISWSSIFAGVVTFIAFLIMFSLIGAAIGFGVTDVTSSDPFAGVGTGLAIWGIFTLLLSLGAAGVVAGITAARAGLVHGFLTWATSVIVLFILLTFTTVNTFQTVGSIFGSVGSTVSQGVGSVASTTGNVIQSTFSNVTDNLSGVDTAELEGNVDEILADTDIPELQPNYLNNQLQESRNEILNAGTELVLNPENSDAIIQDLTDSLTAKAEEIQASVDEEAIANAVASNTDLSETEAEEATANIVDGLNQAVNQATQQLENAQAALDNASQELETAITDLRQTTEEVTDTAAEISIWGFIALLLTMIATSLAGIWGSSLVRKERVVNK